MLGEGLFYLITTSWHFSHYGKEREGMRFGREHANNSSKLPSSDHTVTNFPGEPTIPPKATDNKSLYDPYYGGSTPQLYPCTHHPHLLMPMGQNQVTKVPSRLSFSLKRLPLSIIKGAYASLPRILSH